MRPLARFQTPQEHEEFIKGLIQEMHIRDRIRELQYYRENGIRTFAEAEHFDKEVPRKENLRKSVVYNNIKLNSPRIDIEKSKYDEVVNEKLDITKSPDIELLSQKEIELCSVYLFYKLVITFITKTLFKYKKYINKRSM